MTNEENGDEDELTDHKGAVYKLTLKADEDLGEIWDYTEITWGVEQAEKYLRNIEACLMELACGKKQGHVRQDIREGRFSHNVGKHVVLYRKDNEGIIVLRVLHGSMDIPRHLEST